jgi:hypothetical protein
MDTPEKLVHKTKKKNKHKTQMYWTPLGTDHLICRGVMVFCFFQNFFSDNTRVMVLFFCRAKREFFFQNSTSGYMTKTLNQVIIFFLHQNQNIYFSNIGNQNISFRKINITPPPWKLNGPSLNWGQRGRDRMIVGFKTTCTISAYHH